MLRTPRHIKIKDLESILGDQAFLFVFETSPNPMFLTDKNGKLLLVNSAAERLYGYTRKEFMALEASALAPTHLQELYKKEREVFFTNDGKQKQLERKERIGVSKEGKEIPLDVSYAPIHTESETYLLATVVDLTEKRSQEEELWKTNKFLDSILENIPNMIFVKDAKELRFVRFNKAGEDLLGYSRKDLLGKNDYDFFPKVQADFFTGKDREVLQKFSIFDIPEEPIDTKFGKKWLHTRKITVKDDHGNPAYLLGISEDITERKKAEDEIRHLNSDLKRNVAELESANSELESFSYSVSHDMRAPLRAINGFASILLKKYADKDGKEEKELLGIIIGEASRMGQLIDDLLAFSRLGRKDVQKTAWDMNALVQDVIEEVKKHEPRAEKCQFILRKLPVVDCDPSLMRQVFINLIGNSVKFTQGKEKPLIEVGSSTGKHETTIFVKDNGVGFDMKYYNKLFGVFQRLHSPEEFSGTGIGLAIVKRIISRHGGKVWAESKQGEGATFYFCLPTR